MNRSYINFSIKPVVFKLECINSSLRNIINTSTLASPQNLSLIMMQKPRINTSSR